MTWHRISDPENPPPEELHVRGLWVYRARTGERLYWNADLGTLDDEGDFIAPSGDPTGWRARDYTHWTPLSAPPEGEG